MSRSGLDGVPLWTPARQAGFYEKLGYRQAGTRLDGTPWTRPPETDRFLYNWTERTHLVVCPARASKSYSAAKKVLPLVLGRRVGTDGAPVPTRGWVVGPTYDLAEKEFRYLKADLDHGATQGWWPKPLISRDSKKGGDLYILTAWGSEIVGKSADKPQSLLGEALDWVLLSEGAQLPADIWPRYLEPRLATTRGYAIIPTTPAAGALWLHTLWDRGRRDPAAGIATYTWDVAGNPTYALEELEEKAAFYGRDHPVFREQYLGEWTFYTGTVYGHDFDATRSVIPAYEPPAEWLRVRAIDFGYRDPFVCLWAVVTPDGGLDCYREYYQPQRSMAAHAETLKSLTGTERVQYTVADSSEQQSIADLRRLGVPCLDAQRDRRAGRMLVGDYFRAGKLRIMQGRCPELLRELAFYRWDQDKDKEGAKEATVGDDHAMDALRYLVMSRPRPSAPKVKPGPRTFTQEVQARTRTRLLQAGAVFSGRR